MSTAVFDGMSFGFDDGIALTEYGPKHPETVSLLFSPKVSKLIRRFENKQLGTLSDDLIEDGHARDLQFLNGIKNSINHLVPKGLGIFKGSLPINGDLNHSRIVVAVVKRSAFFSPLNVIVVAGYYFGTEQKGDPNNLVNGLHPISSSKLAAEIQAGCFTTAQSLAKFAVKHSKRALVRNWIQTPGSALSIPVATGKFVTL